MPSSLRSPSALEARVRQPPRVRARDTKACRGARLANIVLGKQHVRDRWMKLTEEKARAFWTYVCLEYASPKPEYSTKPCRFLCPRVRPDLGSHQTPDALRSAWMQLLEGYRCAVQDASHVAGPEV